MRLDDGAVQRHRLDLDADDLPALQMLEKPGQNLHRSGVASFHVSKRKEANYSLDTLVGGFVIPS